MIEERTKSAPRPQPGWRPAWIFQSNRACRATSMPGCYHPRFHKSNSRLNFSHRENMTNYYLWILTLNTKLLRRGLVHRSVQSFYTEAWASERSNSLLVWTWFTLIDELFKRSVSWCRCTIRKKIGQQSIDTKIFKVAWLSRCERRRAKKVPHQSSSSAPERRCGTFDYGCRAGPMLRRRQTGERPNVVFRRWEEFIGEAAENRCTST